MAELVDALVSGTSGESRGGSSPLLGTNANECPFALALIVSLDCAQHNVAEDICDLLQVTFASWLQPKETVKIHS